MTGPSARSPRVLVTAALSLAAAVSLAPLLWLVCASLKRSDDLMAWTFIPWSHPQRLTLDNFRTLFATEPFGRWLVNSIFLSCTYTVLVVTLSSLGGFALAKYRFRGQKVLMAVMLATMLLPAQVLLPGSYELMDRLGWLDSYLAILVPGAVSVAGMFFFRQAMAAVPDELLGAARVDGCSEFRLWWDVAMPVVRPMTAAFTLVSFLSAWNSFLWPQIVLQDESKYTLPLGLANMVSLPQYQQGHWGVLMAGTLLSILPVALLFFALQRDFVAGITTGALRQ